MGRRWTADEDELLRIGYETSMSSADIARSIGNGRSAHAVTCRAAALGLKWGGGDKEARLAAFRAKGAEGLRKRGEKKTAEIRELAAQGLSKKQIRERTGYSGERVRVALLGIKVKHHPRAGIKLKPLSEAKKAQATANLRGCVEACRAKAEREWAAIRDEVIAAVSAGETVKSVAARHKRTREYMSRWLLASGWRRPRKEKPAPRTNRNNISRMGRHIPQADTRGQIPEVVRNLQRFGPCFRHDVGHGAFWHQPPTAYVFAGRTYPMDALPALLARVEAGMVA